MIEITYHMRGGSYVMLEVEDAFGHIAEVIANGNVYMADRTVPSVNHVYPWHMVERVSWISPEEPQ